MIYLSIEWSSIIDIPKLNVGIILAIVGFLIWLRKEHLKKKSEVYDTIMPHIYNLKNIYKSTKYGGLVGKEKEIVRNNLKKGVIPLKEKFIYYFGEKYREPLDDIIDIFEQILECETIYAIILPDEVYINKRCKFIESAKNKRKFGIKRMIRRK